MLTYGIRPALHVLLQTVKTHRQQRVVRLWVTWVTGAATGDSTLKLTLNRQRSVSGGRIKHLSGRTLLIHLKRWSVWRHVSLVSLLRRCFLHRSGYMKHVHCLEVCLGVLSRSQTIPSNLLGESLSEKMVTVRFIDQQSVAVNSCGWNGFMVRSLWTSQLIWITHWNSADTFNSIRQQTSGLFLALWGTFWCFGDATERLRERIFRTNLFTEQILMNQYTKRPVYIGLLMYFVFYLSVSRN